jgi:hypothetical protein
MRRGSELTGTQFAFLADFSSTGRTTNGKLFGDPHDQTIMKNRGEEVWSILHNRNREPRLTGHGITSMLISTYVAVFLDTY